MKNKITVFLCLTVIISSFIFCYPAYAESSYTGAFIMRDTNNNWYVAFGGTVGTYSISWNSNYNTFSLNGISCYGYWTSLGGAAYKYSSLEQALSVYNTIKDYSSDQLTLRDRGRGDINFIIKMRGTFTNETLLINNDNYYSSYDDYIDATTPKWYEVLWDDFKQFVSDLGLELLTPFDPNSIIDIADWFENAWTVKVGEGEDDLLNQIDVVTPTPVPPSPTPIPYQTVIVPDGNGGSIIQYKYLNPSGTPIITDQPPQQNVTVNNDDDNGFEYPYYENPENKDNPFKFKIPWYLKLVLRHNDIDIDTLDDHYQVAQNQVQSEDVVNAVNEVYNGFQVLPADWLLLLGAIASIPLFAALIHRFLQG